jgi:hypothetical protein
VRWRDAPVSFPENAFLGVMYEADFTWGLSFPWIVGNSTHWIYDGTELHDGDAVPGLVGYEYDRVFDNGHTPPGELSILATSPIALPDGRSGIHNAVIHTASSGAFTFVAGTNYWPWALDDNEYTTLPADPRVQRMTTNLLDAMIHGAPPRQASAPKRERRQPLMPNGSAYRATILADEPIAYWRLGEQTGLVAFDERGAHDGLYTGEPLLRADGALEGDDDTAADFVGEDQHVAVHTVDGLSPEAGEKGQVTLEAWVYLHRVPAREPGTVVAKGGVGSYEYALRVHPSGTAEMILWSLDGTTYQAAESDPGVVVAGAWYHLVGTCENGVACRMYINGRVHAVTTAGWGPTLPGAGGAPVTIGRRLDGVQSLPAVIDEVAIYPAALRPDQIQAHYATRG